MKIAKESVVIAVIGLADLVTTIVFIQHHGAQEANPVFRHYWEMGLLVFIAAKLVCLLGPLSVLEWARRRRPRFVSLALRSAIVGYLALYCIGVSHLNTPQAHANEVTRLVAPDSPRAMFASAAAMGGRVLADPFPDGRVVSRAYRRTAFSLRVALPVVSGSAGR